MYSKNATQLSVVCFLMVLSFCVRVYLAVQIPPSTAYAPPMKRPIEEEEGIDDKSPNKKKKKLQKKCKCHFSSCICSERILPTIPLSKWVL